MAIIIEKTDAAFNTQLKNFAGKISNYSATLGLTAAEVTAIKADSVAFDYLTTNQASVLVKMCQYSPLLYKHWLYPL